MQIYLTEDQTAELLALVSETLRDMSHEIAATDNSQYRVQLLARRRTLEGVAGSLLRQADSPPRRRDQGSLHRAGVERVWTAEVLFTEDEDRTRADARIHSADFDWHGWGRARRNPIDPDVPAVGEELAAARALADLSHQLVIAAAHGVEAFEGRPVRLHI